MLKEGHWFARARFGMFVHWGLYALLGGEYQGRRTQNLPEWILHDLAIPLKEYEALAASFNPSAFDARGIARLAREAGMGYMVFTAKHHDGFAMFRSRASAFNLADGTPFGQDAVRELKTACQEEGLRFGLYYSQAQDWHHPGGIEEGRRDPNPGFRRYLQEKCVPQLEELLTGYGEIDLIWFDTPMSMSCEESLMLRDLVRKLQPGCLVSGRIGHGLGDYMTTGDNFIPLLSRSAPFEVPATINRSWGYSAFDRHWKSVGRLIRDLVRVVGRGGNYLLNIGPDALGRVPEQSFRALMEIGAFMKHSGESILEAVPVPVYPYELGWGHFTARPGRLYIHVFEPLDEIYLINMGNRPLGATLLWNEKPLELRQRVTGEGMNSWRIPLPRDLPVLPDTVIRVDLAEEEVIFEPISD